MPVVEIKLKGMDWPTLQSFYGKRILDPVKTDVCSLVYISAIKRRSGKFAANPSVLDYLRMAVAKEKPWLCRM